MLWAEAEAGGWGGGFERRANRGRGAGGGRIGHLGKIRKKTPSLYTGFWPINCREPFFFGPLHIMLLERI